MGISSQYSHLGIGFRSGTLEITGERVKGKWPVQCDCGRTMRRQSDELCGDRIKRCGCFKPNHFIGEIIKGRKVVRLGGHQDSCLIVECLKCLSRAKIRATAKQSYACRKCEGFLSMGFEGNIYGVICPITGSIVYVGATKDSCEHRLNQHWKHKGSKARRNLPFYKWLKLLEQQGGYPGIITLESVSGDSLADREVFWIQKLSQDGCDLFNTDGKGGLTLSAP